MTAHDSDVLVAYLDLTHRYADEVDRRNGAAVAALFTPDGAWDGTAFKLDPVQGRADLQRHFSGGPVDVTSIHLVLNHRVLEASHDAVVATSLGHVVQQHGSDVRHLIVRYSDRLERRETWLFAERTLHRELRF